MKRFESVRRADGAWLIVLCLSGAMLSGCGRTAPAPPPVATSSAVVASDPFVSFVIDEPKKGQRIKADTGKVTCQGTIRITAGASAPERALVTLLRNGSIAGQKFVEIKPAETPGTYRFESSFGVKSKGKYSFKAEATIGAANMVRIGEPPPRTYDGAADTVPFQVESVPAKKEPTER